MEDATCIRSCAVIIHRATINPFERLCSPALQKESSRIWKETSYYCWINNASSVEASILLESEWGSFEMSGPISDEGLFISDVVIHSTKQFAEKIEQMWRSDTEISEGPDYR